MGKPLWGSIRVKALDESPEPPPCCLITGAPKRHGSPSACNDIDLDRVPKEYLWRLFGDDVSPWEVAELCQNVIAAQEDRLLKG
jgi:hypothetical protein